jgi:hypothetical protein
MNYNKIIIDNPQNISIKYIYGVVPLAVNSSYDIKVAGTTIGDIHTTFYRNKKSLRIKFYTNNKGLTNE